MAVAMRPVNDLSLHWASLDLRIIIVDIVFECLHVSVRLSFEVVVSKHVADLFQVVWRLQTNKRLLI
jgi:hypothetical protein